MLKRDRGVVITDGFPVGDVRGFAGHGYRVGERTLRNSVYVVSRLPSYTRVLASTENDAAADPMVVRWMS